MHAHHPPQNKVVALTSTTLSSLEFVSHSQGNSFVPFSTLLHANNTLEKQFSKLEAKTYFMFANGKVSESCKEEEENEAKTWSISPF